MVKIDLSLNEKKYISNKWSYNIYVEKRKGGYYILYNGKEYGPYFEVHAAKVTASYPERTLYAFQGVDADIYTIMPDGLTFKQKIDRTEELQEEFIKIFDSLKCEELYDCNFITKYRKYHYYKDKDGRFFVVDITRPIKKSSCYKKFDSVFELATYARVNKIDCYDEYILRHFNNQNLRKFIADFKKGTCEYGLTNPQILPVLNRVKELIGIKKYLNLDGELRYIHTKVKYINMDEFEKELASNAELFKNPRVEIWVKSGYLMEMLNEGEINQHALGVFINNHARKMMFDLDSPKIAYNGVILTHPNMTDEEKKNNLVARKCYRWQGLDKLKEEQPESYAKIVEICKSKICEVYGITNEFASAE